MFTFDASVVFRDTLGKFSAENVIFSVAHTDTRGDQKLLSLTYFCSEQNLK